ncbi:hypothetical protein T081_005046 [Salmonella enterica subsp. enterica serovar Monophasic]|nr:hypothetical protein [Salmonella enterica subsp. enterica serovar Hvittingfoss]EDV9206022.1 hypothetical protein [Salmonella enterica subsp. enterica serovar Monophasic]
MKIINGPILCPYCGSLSTYYEIDRVSALREKLPEQGHREGWNTLLKKHKKKAFCLMCHRTIELPLSSGEK